MNDYYMFIGIAFLAGMYVGCVVTETLVKAHLNKLKESTDV